MKRLLAACILLTALPQARAATVAPSFAVAGTSMRLNLTQPLPPGTPELFVGGQRVREVRGDGRTWDFRFPDQVLPGPQPVRMVLNGQFGRAQVVGWVEAVQTSPGLVTVVRNQETGALPWTEVALRDLIARRVQAPRQPNSYSATYLKLLRGLKIEDLRMTRPLDRSSYRVGLPEALLEDVQRWKLSGVPALPPELLAALRQRLPVGVRAQELASVLQNQQATVRNALLPTLTYKVKLESLQQAPDVPTQGGAVLAFTPAGVPGLNVRLPPATSSAAAMQTSICGKPRVQIKATGEQVAILADLLYMDKAVTLDPTGYGIPSQAPPESGANAALTVTGVITTAGQRLNGAAAGRGVKVYVVDSGLSSNAPAGQGPASPQARQAFASHGAAVARIISDMVPAAEVILAPACTDEGVCHGDLILQHLCEAANQARSGPVVVNLSLHLPYRSPALKKALAEVTAAGALVVMAHGNRDRCEKATTTAPFKDHCNAYPADWTGRPVTGVPYPTDETGTGFQRNHRLFSAGGWDVAGAGKAEFGREGSGRPYVPVTTPTRYLPGAFEYTLAAAAEPRLYEGTSFASPVLAALLANWISLQPAPHQGLTPALESYQPGQPESQILRYEWLLNVAPLK
ncbi:S8/S53 family peptidase [Deinococcus aquaedulcis]|uniref:S8 family serine peptidase n=1 Tax=Deinococcus aquaedulcis TaxID=2840455 RepID=UPI001C83F635|nr:S8 family serine peptidase [Deinococcus aquaedulcis]